MDLTYDPKTSRLSDGREVAQCAFAQVKHPHPLQNGKMVLTKSVYHLFVVDTDPSANEFIEMYACNFKNTNCFKVFESAQSVTAHMPSHTRKRFKQWTDDQLRLIVRECKKAIADGHRNYAHVAADALNQQGMLNLNHRPMTDGLVSQLYIANRTRFRIYLKPRTTERKSVKVDPDPFDDKLGVPKVTETPPSTVTRIDRMFNDITGRLSDAQVLMGDLAREILDLATQVEKYGTVNDEIREKAEKYEQMKNLLGRD